MPFEHERRELDVVLASGIFSRAPSLVQLLTYICNRYFDGEAAQIKEYNIAVEGLSRPPDFDQKKDSIVRVEAHRLRKRLREYYEGDGASHDFHIVVQPGQYVPKFVPKEADVATDADSDSSILVEEIPASEPEPAVVPASLSNYTFRLPKQAVLWGALLAAAAVGVFFVSLKIGSSSAATSTLAGGLLSGARIETSAPAQSDEVRIMAGRLQGDYMDRQTHLWKSDRYFTGGYANTLPGHPFTGTHDPKMYESHREGDFQYDIPLRPGTYEMRLHFAETVFGEQNIAGGGETSRLFNVFANGVRLLENFDIIADAGASMADIRAFRDITPAADGLVHLRFEHINRGAVLSAIEITTGLPGRLRPIRIVASDRPYTSADSSIWAADGYSTGGQLIARPGTITGTTDPGLYNSERFGNIQYVIPVPAGRYGLTLKFAETWFGPNKPSAAGAGNRLFDILCNGTALERDFDIYREAGGSDRAVDRTFHNIKPNAQGKLVISLLPVKNYACINALEVLDESR